jgi:hypothetical protein
MSKAKKKQCTEISWFTGELSDENLFDVLQPEWPPNYVENLN